MVFGPLQPLLGETSPTDAPDTPKGILEDCHVDIALSDLDGRCISGHAIFVFAMHAPYTPSDPPTNGVLQHFNDEHASAGTLPDLILLKPQHHQICPSCRFPTERLYPSNRPQPLA